MKQPTQKNQTPIDWFRQASPYINKYRGSTFVLVFGGEALSEDRFPELIHDITLLSHLGIRLVLVHGVRAQIDAEMAAKNIEPVYHQGLRVTTDESLELVKRISGTVRIGIEALLSMGLPNTPMSGARLSIISGNFVTARPLGIHDGVDFCHTGEVRRVESAMLQQQLDNGNLILLSPLGYSPTGDVFNLRAEDVAAEVAIALRAEKLIYLTEKDGIKNATGAIHNQLSTRQAEQLLTNDDLSTSEKLILTNAIKCCRRGVHRSHIINRHVEGALLTELFTRDGIGTLVSGESYDGLRAANIDDVGGLMALIQPLEEDGSLVSRTREQLELEISHFTVIERDGTITACAALHPIDETFAELACVATHPNYTGGGRADTILQHIEAIALEQGLSELVVLTTRTAHWFQERGFLQADLNCLPVKRRGLYNYQRKSKVFIKKLNSK